MCEREREGGGEEKREGEREEEKAEEVRGGGRMIPIC